MLNQLLFSIANLLSKQILHFYEGEEASIEELYMTLIEWNSIEATDELQTIIDNMDSLMNGCKQSPVNLAGNYNSMSFHYMNWLEYDTEKYLF